MSVIAHTDGFSSSCCCDSLGNEEKAVPGESCCSICDWSLCDCRRDGDPTEMKRDQALKGLVFGI